MEVADLSIYFEQVIPGFCTAKFTRINIVQVYGKQEPKHDV